MVNDQIKSVYLEHKKCTISSDLVILFLFKVNGRYPPPTYLVLKKDKFTLRDIHDDEIEEEIREAFRCFDKDGHGRPSGKSCLTLRLRSGNLTMCIY